MKNLKFLLFIYIMACFAGCTTEYNTDDTGIKVTPPSINTLSKTDWKLTKPTAGEDPLVFRLSWTKARYNYDNGNYIYTDDISYDVQVDLTENNFAKAKTIITTKEVYTDFLTIKFKTILDDLKGEETITPQNISIRIKATSSKGECFSEPLNLTLTSYYTIDPVAKNVYIIGDMNGWDNTSKNYIMFRNSNNYQDGTYTYTGYFPTAAYFKFCSEEFLGSYDNMYCAGSGGVLQQGDLGAFYVTAGYHTITINTQDMTWEITDPNITNSTVYNQMGPIGGFCNWDNEPMMTKSTFDPHQWRINYDFTSSTACKFRGNHDWANNWGGTDAEIPYGKAIFDGPGATIQNAGNYNIYFNDLTGHYAIVKQ